MTTLLVDKLRTLAGAIAALQARVRAAVAEGVARVLGGAVQEVVRAVAAGRATGETPATEWGDRRPSAARWDEDDPDPWHDESERGDGYEAASGRAWDGRPDPKLSAGPPVNSGLTAAVAAGVHVARWWLARRGTALVAAGLGLGVGLLGAAGGPAAGLAVAVAVGVADLLGAADALGAGAARLAHF